MTIKNILIFSREFPPKIGGMGIVAKEYAEILSSHNYSVTVLTDYRNNYNYKTVVDKYTIQTQKIFSKFWFINYKRSLDFNTFDLIILNDPDSAYIAGKYFSKELLLKCVIVLHGSEPEYIFKKNSISKSIINFKKYYTLSLQHCKTIIAVSDFMKDKFIKETELVELENKINIIHTPISTKQFFRKKSNFIYKEFNLQPSSQILLSVSRLVKKKGYYNMFKIFEDLYKNNKNLVWIIVGEGNYKKELENIIYKSKLASNIILVGKVERNDLSKYYSNVNLFWLLSEFEESFGLVYLEAQSCGCPVIGNNNAGVKEVITNDVSGFLVNNNEDCFNIINDTIYYKLSTDDIINNAKKFNIDKFISNFNNLIA